MLKLQATMKLIHKGTAPVYGLSTFTCACGITTLDHEVLDHSVEEGTIVVTLQTELEEVAACPWSLSRPEIYLYGAMSSLKYHFACSLRLLLIYCRHFCYLL